MGSERDGSYGEHDGDRVNAASTVIDLNRTRNGWWQVVERDVRVIRSYRDKGVAESVTARARDAAERLDRHWPKRGQCGICGVPGEDQRHRMVDAVAEHVRAGESVEEVAEDYGVTPAAVQAALDWTALDG